MAKAIVTKLKCLQCGKVLAKSRRPQRKKFCDDHCRWRFHNAERADAVKQVRSMKLATQPTGGTD